MAQLAVYFVAIWWISCAVATSRGPPKIVGKDLKPLQMVVQGHEFRTICPIEGSTIVEWYKDGEPITSSWTRFRANSRTLKIRSALAEDSGIYECKGVNGFGSQITRIRLVVIDDDSMEGENAERSEMSRQDFLTTSLRSFSSPVLSVETMEQSGTMHLSSGNTIRFRCEAKGTPTPRVTWLKDGKPVGEKMWRTSSWTLVLDRLATEDAGTYTCSANNSVGSAESAIHLLVTDMVEKKRPELAPNYPNNLTVLVGNRAVLECVVRSGSSSMAPHIKWLKRVAEGHNRKTITWRQRHRLLPVENQHVVVIQETHDEAIRISETQLNGTFMSKLIFSRATEEDDGVFICLATNNVGYTYKEARLTVCPATTLGTENELVPYPVLVLVIVITVATIVFVSSCGLHYHFRRIQEYPPSPTQTKYKPQKPSAPSINNPSTYQNLAYEQRQLLVSTANSTASGSLNCQSQLVSSEPTIEIAMSHCSCCGQRSSEISAIKTYEQCFGNPHSVQLMNWQ